MLRAGYPIPTAGGRVGYTGFPMKVWLVQPAEPSPVEKGNNRLWRTGFTAYLLDRLGHEVVWFESRFSHVHKRFIEAEPVVRLSERYEIRLLDALGYRKHISLARLRDHRYVSKRLAEQMRRLPKPDIIVCSFPTIECAAESVRYSLENEVPIVVDVRDQWPDLMVDAVPRPLRPLAQLACLGMSREANYAFRHATAITGNAQQAMEWGVARAGRKPGELDRAFPMGYHRAEYPQAEREAARAALDQKGVDAGGSRFLAVYGGAIGETGDFDTILEAARALAKDAPRVQIVLAGEGDALGRLRQAAEGLPNVVLTGWLKAAEMSELLAMASVGLVPYKERANFEGGITNKPIEYLAFGLPVVTTLKRGALHDLLAENRCGEFYTCGSAQELARSVRGLAENPERLAEMSRRALELYERSFRAETVYGEMIEHFWKVLEAYRAGLRR